jgi:hypothetical protein
MIVIVQNVKTPQNRIFLDNPRNLATNLDRLFKNNDNTYCKSQLIKQLQNLKHMSTTEEIINSATAQTQNAASKLPEIGANNPSKKLKNIIILFGFLLIASLLANMIMYFMVSGNGSKVKVLEDRNAALSNQLASKSNLADRSQVIEQQLKKATDDLAAQVKINEDASSKVLAAEKSVKDNKDELTSLRAKVAASDAQINNLKAAKADAEGAIANIKKSLGSLAN